MRFSNNGTTWSDPETYSATKFWTLPTGDGAKTIYVKFKDTLGTWSNAFTVSITLDTTAPVTAASPVEGTYGSTQSVTLSANEQATIYYTTDGTTPTELSTVYSNPIPIAATTALKFFAKDTAGNVEVVKTQTYTIKIGISGDLDGDGAVTLADAIIALQVMMTIRPQGLRSNYTTSNADVNGDGCVGMSELLYILQKVSDVR